jgi:hypothetical protein
VCQRQEKQQKKRNSHGENQAPADGVKHSVCDMCSSLVRGSNAQTVGPRFAAAEAPHCLFQTTIFHALLAHSEAGVILQGVTQKVFAGGM